MSETPVIGEEIMSTDEPLRIRTWQEILRAEQHKKPLNERVDSMTYVKPFPIKEVDLLTIKRFIQYSRFNSKNDWGVGLKMLLDYVDSDAKNLMMFDKMMQIEDKVHAVMNEIEHMKEQPQKDKKSTFGGK